jgi:hypothetical protein
LTITRRKRAESRVVTICYPDGRPAGFIVRGWHPGQQVIGPFASYEFAIQAALKNTGGLAIGARRRYTK